MIKSRILVLVGDCLLVFVVSCCLRVCSLVRTLLRSTRSKRREENTKKIDLFNFKIILKKCIHFGIDYIQCTDDKRMVAS